MAKAYARRDDWLRALIALKSADELESDNPEIQHLYNRYQNNLRAQLAE